MRDYSKVTPRYWTGGTGKQLRGHPEAQIVGAYLMTCHSANMIGLYYLPLPTLEHETGLTHKGALKGLARVSEVGFARYDAPSEYVFVVEMARIQVGDYLKADDNRVKGLQKEVESHRRCPFFNDFLAKYSGPFHLNIEPTVVSPLGGPPKPERETGAGTEDRTGTEEGTGEEGATPAAFVPELLLKFGEFGRARLTQVEHDKLKAELNGNLETYITDFDRWVEEAPDAKDKNGVKRKDRNPYLSIGNWFRRDRKEGKIQTGESNGKSNPNARAAENFVNRHMAKSVCANVTDVRKDT